MNPTSPSAATWPVIHADVDARFYETLPPFERFDDVANPSVYHRVPDSWHVVLTDVRGSTKAIEQGRYKDVNGLGVSTIAAALNCIRDISFPFVFGGDGSTLVVPATHLDQAIRAARNAMTLARDAFDMELRAGVVPVSELSAAGVEVRVARLRVSPHITLAMFEGGGLSHAERLIKDPVQGKRYLLEPLEHTETAVFEGFECRWKPIATRKDNILTLLVVALAEDQHAQREVYRRVIDGIRQCAPGGEESLRPVGESNLDLYKEASAYATEARVRTGRRAGVWAWLYRLKVKILVAGALFLLRTGWSASDPKLGRFNGTTYKRDVAANTDFRKFDDTLRMVIDVTTAESAAIQAYLEREHAAGQIAYGTHISSAALMTCLIKDFGGDHVHFVDGSDGGYALAAKKMKAQLKALRGG